MSSVFLFGKQGPRGERGAKILVRRGVTPFKFPNQAWRCEVNRGCDGSEGAPDTTHPRSCGGGTTLSLGLVPCRTANTAACAVYLEMTEIYSAVDVVPVIIATGSST